jgi:cysteine desulfurase
MNRPIYLDYQATTPCDPRVVQEMMPYLIEEYGNPHSRNHVFGWRAEEAVEKSRAIIAKAVGADPREIVFTSGATESNNLAIKGAAYFASAGSESSKPHLIASSIEHKCVLESLRSLEQEGFSVTFLPVLSNGLVDLKQLKEAIRPETILVSVMFVNNEIGVVQPVEEIGNLCRSRGIYFHTDAAQALGRLEICVEKMKIDLMSLSSHKVYGPKGVGALYVRRRPRVRLRPLFHGGGQERGLRSGTVPPFLTVGFAKATELAVMERAQEAERLLFLQKRFLNHIQSHLEDTYVNGDIHARIPGNLNISFFGVEGEGLMMAIKDLAVSSGSACTSASLEPSYVLRALGVGEELAHTSLRIGFGRFTTEAEVDQAALQIVTAVNRLRDMSPLWEMHKEGIDLSAVQWSGH